MVPPNDIPPPGLETLFGGVILGALRSLCGVCVICRRGSDPLGIPEAEALFRAACDRLEATTPRDFAGGPAAGRKVLAARVARELRLLADEFERGGGP